MLLDPGRSLHKVSVILSASFVQGPGLHHRFTAAKSRHTAHKGMDMRWNERVDDFTSNTISSIMLECCIDADGRRRKGVIRESRHSLLSPASVEGAVCEASKAHAHALASASCEHGNTCTHIAALCNVIQTPSLCIAIHWHIYFGAAFWRRSGASRKLLAAKSIARLMYL